MRTIRPLPLLACLFAVSCGDLASTPNPFDFTEPEEPIELGIVEAQKPAVMPIPTLLLPTPEGCTDVALSGQAQVDNTRVGEPVLVETFGRDGCLDERWRRTYEGDLITTEHYEIFDDELAHYVYVAPEDYYARWTYVDDLMSTHTVAPSADDEPRLREAWTHDDLGRVTRYVQESGGTTGVEEYGYEGGSENFVFYRHDINGEFSSQIDRELGPREQVARETRTRAGREPVVVIERSFDASGNPVHLFSRDEWTGRDASEQWYKRRSDGTLRRHETKNLEAGWWDVAEFDERERKVLYTQDEEHDGPIEYRQIWRYDGDNVVFQSTEYDFHRPHTAYSERRARYDAQGRLVETIQQEVWLDDDIQRSTRTYEPTGSGFLLEVIRESPSGARVTIERSYHLDDTRMLWSERDNNRDGEIDSREWRTWDGDLLTGIQRDHDGDMTVDRVENRLYDAAGQLVAQLIDDDGDGVADQRLMNER